MGPVNIAEVEQKLLLSESELAAIVADRLEESIDDIRNAMRAEDVGWTLIKGHGDDGEGLTLKDLKEWSEKIRSSVIAAPWIKRGFGLRHSYVWKGGMHHVGIAGEGQQGVANIQKRIDDPQNVREFFGVKARRKTEGRLYYDGFAVWIGNNSTKKLESIPLEQIHGILRHPEHPETIVAYLRKWEKFDFATGTRNGKKLYYIVNGYEDLFEDITEIRPTQDSTYAVKLAKGYTAFHLHANAVDGFAFGAPDALAAWIWNQVARDAYLDGTTMTKALASIAFKASSPSKTAAQNMALKMAGSRSAARTASMGAATDITAINSAGKGYDFDSLRALTAIIAAALDVSNIALLADSSAAGSSYGAASTLDQPTLNAMLARRDEHIELELEVLTWMGAKSPKARFDTLLDYETIYRGAQAETLGWLQGIEKPDVYQGRMERILGLLPTELGGVPDGVLIPNNEKSLARPDVDADGKPAPTGSTGSPSQGRSNDGNGEDPTNSNDIRRD